MLKPLLSLALLLAFLPLAAAAQVSQNLALQPGPVLTLPAGADMTALAIADFNSDNRRDLAVCQRGLDAIGVYLQTAARAFPATASGTYATGTAPTGLVATGLSNAATQPFNDLAAVSGPSASWTLLRNNGNGQGTFTPVTGTPRFGLPSYVGTSPQLQVAYLNTDRYLDYAYTYDAPTQYGIHWKAYTGNGSFLAGTYGIATGTFVPSSFALTDFDRDGSTDVVYTNANASEIRAIPGVVGSNWYVGGQAIMTTGFSQPVDVTTGDLNYDFLPDIAVANRGNNSLTVVVNLGTWNFASPALYPLSAAPRRVLLQDLNGDNLPEMITITADNQLQVFRHTGSAGAARYGTPLTLATGVDPTLLQVADMNSDGAADVVVGCPGDNTVRVYYNRSQAMLATAAPLLAGVGVFPNPATDLLRLDAPDLREPLHATLLDVTGRTVREATLSPTARTLPVADLPRGLYLLRLTSQQGSRVWHVALR